MAAKKKSSDIQASLGRRKTAVARLRIKPATKGKHRLLCNGKPYEAYFARETIQHDILRPLKLSEKEESFDIVANLSGSGLSGQAGALRLAIAKGLLLFHPELRPVLKRNGMLRRDSRSVQRKLYGHKKARRSFQFSKR